MKSNSIIPELINKNEKALLAEWLDLQKAVGTGDLAGDEQLRSISHRFMGAFKEGMRSGEFTDTGTSAWASVRTVLEDVSQQRALRGATPSQTATFVFSLKLPLFNAAAPRARQGCRAPGGGDLDRNADPGQARPLHDGAASRRAARR